MPDGFHPPLVVEERPLRNVLLTVLSLTSLLGAAEPDVSPRVAPVPDPPATICHAKPDDAVVVAAQSLLAGYGTGGFAIRTASPEAQAYFDNGMQLAHAFAHEAAIAAFERAEELDPQCAMCAWGEAWSRGPTINYTIDAAKAAALVVLADRAASLAADGPAKERAWTAALQKRYRDGGGGGTGDLAFARAMDAFATANPSDDEIAVVAADGWMIPASHRDSRDHLDRALALLRSVLARSPDDTGAIHFYIHATEMNDRGADALPYAERLQADAPAASHLVHMPSHTYFRVGRFRAAEQANVDAAAIEERDTLRIKPKDGVFGLDYHRHNVQFGTVAALLDGDSAGALTLAKPMLQQLATVKPDQAWPQIAASSAYAAYGRYGTDAMVDALPEPDADLPYARAMRHYARGEAAARRGDVVALGQAIAALMLPADALKAFGDSAERGRTMIDVARLVLQGRAAMLEHRFGDATDAYRKAADLQDEKIGSGGDPPVWWYPVRRSLAVALLANGRTADAAEEIRKTLLAVVGDPLSERIFADIQSASGRSDDATRWLAAARSGWLGDPAAVPAALL